MIIKSTSYQLNPVGFNTGLSDKNSCERIFEKNILFPFQLQVPFEFKDPQTFKPKAFIVDAQGEEFEITKELTEAGLRLVNRFSRYLVKFPAKFVVNLKQTSGCYNLRIELGSLKWTSDKFRLLDTIPGQLSKLTWSNNTTGQDISINGGFVDFSEAFEYFLYLDTNVSNIDYSIVEEIMDRDGAKFPTKMISEMTYNTTDITGDPALVDCLRLVNMCDDITLTSRGVTYEIENILFTPKWASSGSNIANISCEFSLGNYIKRIGFDYTREFKGDFNNDFNNDYKK